MAFVPACSVVVRREKKEKHQIINIQHNLFSLDNSPTPLGVTIASNLSTIAARDNFQGINRSLDFIRTSPISSNLYFKDLQAECRLHLFMTDLMSLKFLIRDKGHTSC